MIPKKVPKRSVNYRPAKPGGPRCGQCTMFEPKTNTCTSVMGVIKRNDWCTLFTPKAGK